MGTGTDIAIEASDITLVRGDLTQIAAAIKLSRHTIGIIRQNLFWAFIYNIIGIPSSLGILVPGDCRRSHVLLLSVRGNEFAETTQVRSNEMSQSRMSARTE